MVTVPVLAPTTDGVAVIVNVAEEPAATGLAGLNALTANPETPVIEVTFNGASPEFVIVIVVTGAAAIVITAVPNDNAGALFDVMVVAPCETDRIGAGGGVPVTLTFNRNVGVAGSLV